MGEFATYKGERIKIGTCENLYYLRADQKSLVQRTSGSVDPNSADRYAIRFRFPWPDEDRIQPGDFADYDRSVDVPGVPVPAAIEHNDVPFTSASGHRVYLACPQSSTPPARVQAPYQFMSTVRLVQQKYLRDGRLVPILRCGTCSARYRMEDRDDIEGLVVACRSMADRAEVKQGEPYTLDATWWHTVADRIAADARL